MSKTEDLIVVGRFGKPHGIKGYVTVHSFTEPRDNLLSYTSWHAFLNKEWRPVSLLSTQVHNKSIVAQVEGYATRELAAFLTNVDIAIRQHQLAPLASGQYYWYQLIGMTVVNQQGFSLGEVLEIMPTGSNDVLVVKGEKRVLIPYLPGIYIMHVDDKTRTITADWDVDF